MWQFCQFPMLLKVLYEYAMGTCQYLCSRPFFAFARLGLDLINFQQFGFAHCAVFGSFVLFPMHLKVLGEYKMGTGQFMLPYVTEKSLIIE